MTNNSVLGGNRTNSSGPVTSGRVNGINARDASSINGTGASINHQANSVGTSYESSKVGQRTIASTNAYLGGNDGARSIPQTRMTQPIDKESPASIERRKERASSVQQWHSENREIQSKLNGLQPMLSEALQKVMQFSNEITESYVIQFARMSIDLFNLISDNYVYHFEASARANNQDYTNSVANYQEFIDMLIDNMAAFGVEMISSKAGTRFDGIIHEVPSDNSGFSPRTSIVRESIRAGFRYKDVILQKEKIRICNSR